MKFPQFAVYYHISLHYGVGLRQTFDLFPDAPGVIVLEEDISIAPDALSYFRATLPLLLNDTTLMAVSAFNDNGAGPGHEPKVDALHRSDFFPGLGWLMPRRIWNELGPKWADSFWDDWMRNPEQRRGRQFIRPELSRTHTFGERGASGGQFYKEHLEGNSMNEQPFDWEAQDLSYLSPAAYDNYLDNLIRGARRLNEVPSSWQSHANSTVMLLYDSMEQFVRIARNMHLMEDEKNGVPRTGYRQVVLFRVTGNAAFAKKPASSTDDSAVAAPVAAEISSSTDDAVAAPSTVVDESFFALRRLNSSDSGSLSGTTAWRGDLALAQASAALDVVQEASAVAAIDGSVHVVTHTGASLRVLPPSGERVTLVYLLANAGLVAVGIGAALELIDFTDANAIKSVFKHEFAAAVTALAFTAGEAHLFVGLASGDVHVVVVAAQEGTAPFYVSAFVIDVVDTHSDCADDATRKVASRGKAAVTHIVPLPKANNVSLIIAYAESNVVVRYNITAQKTERLYSKRDGVGEKPLSCVAVHPNNDDVLCVHADGQFVLYNDKRNAPAVWFSVSGGDGADIGSGVSSLVWTTGADDEHIIALVRYDSDFKHSVVSVLTGERIDALRVAGELSAPKNVAYLSLALLTASPFEHQHATHALAVRDDGKFVAVALANGDSWQPSKLPSLWHVNRAPIAVAQVAQVSSTAMFIGDDAPEELTRDALWPGKRKSTIATSVSTADPALVMIAAQSDMSVSVFELASQQAVFHVDLSAALLAAKVSEPPRLSGVADCLAVSRAGRPLLLVSCIAGGEESEERCVLLFATSAPRGAPAAAGVAKVESDFGVFACQGVVARGPLARLERAHDAAIAVSCDATVTVFALDDKGALSQHTFQRPSDSVNAALLSNDSVALLLSNHAIVRVSNVIEDGTELRAASTDAEALRAPIKGFFALTSDASARFYGEQDVPRFLSCAGREVRLTTPEWLAADSALSLEERDFLTVDDTAAQCGGLVRRAWLVRGGENNSLYCVIYTAREQLQVFRASDLAPCATFPLDTVAQTDRKPVEIYLTCDGRGIVVTPLEAVAITVWANSKAPPDATAATSEAAPVRSDVGVFVPDAPLPERKSGLIGALFGTVKKNRNKALSVLSAPAAAASSSSSSSSAGAGGQHKAQGEVRSAASVMEHTKQRLLENQEKMQEVADKSADLADQSANFASLAAQLNQESQKKSFFGF